MKRTPPQGLPPGNPTAPAQERSLASRFRLALLDEHQVDRPGYNPYETAGGKKRDVWGSKPKRA